MDTIDMGMTVGEAIERYEMDLEFEEAEREIAMAEAYAFEESLEEEEDMKRVLSGIRRTYGAMIRELL